MSRSSHKVKGFWFERELFESAAYADLSRTAMRLLNYFMLRRVMLPWKHKGFTTFRVANNGSIIFTFREAKEKYKIGMSTFLEARDRLIRIGFLDIAEQGTGGLMRSATKYALSDRWRKYGAGDFVSAPRQVDSRHVGWQRRGAERHLHGDHGERQDGTTALPAGEGGSSIECIGNPMHGEGEAGRKPKTGKRSMPAKPLTAKARASEKRCTAGSACIGKAMHTCIGKAMLTSAVTPAALADLDARMAAAPARQPFAAAATAQGIRQHGAAAAAEGGMTK